MKSKEKLTSIELNEIYSILVEYCGTKDDVYDRYFFISDHLVIDHPLESRICLALGFGGKFKRNNSRVWVSQYPETATLKSRDLEDSVNEILKSYWKL